MMNKNQILVLNELKEKFGEEYIFDETKSIINRAIECIKEIEDFAVVEDSLAESLYGKADKKKSTLGVYTKENNEKVVTVEDKSIETTPFTENKLVEVKIQILQ